MQNGRATLHSGRDDCQGGRGLGPSYPTLVEKISQLHRPSCFFFFRFTEFQAPKCIYVVAEDDLEFHGAFSLQDEPKNERPCWINDEDMSHLVFDKEIECWKVCNDVEVTWHHTYVVSSEKNHTNAVCVWDHTNVGDREYDET